MTLLVEILAPERRFIRFENQPLITIGRDPANHVVLDDTRVSRRHALIEVTENGLWLQNLSENGLILLAGRRVESDVPVSLALESELKLADFRLRISAAQTYTAETAAAFRRRVHRLMLERLDLAQLGLKPAPRAEFEPQVLRTLDALLEELAIEAPAGLSFSTLRKELCDEALGLGPLEAFLSDPTISEIMVVDRNTIYVERRGKIESTDAHFSSDEVLRAIIERIVTPLGRRIDELQPLVDARLPDGSRVHAAIPPVALRGPSLTIRKFSPTKLTAEDLIRMGSLNRPIARFLEQAVQARRNILVSGGTGSGKTTLLNVLSQAIPATERIITVEDASELKLGQPHVVSLETRPPNLEGRGELTIRELVRNTLRMRPDRIIVGECRAGEALDMLQAMNTGHDGSLTTVHASSPEEALRRIETLTLMAGLDLPARAIREQIASAIHVIVQTARFGDGTRKITHVAEVVGIDEKGSVRAENVFIYARSRAKDGSLQGEFQQTGYRPSFVERWP